MNKLYHYTMCGLDNVWLENGYTEHKTPYGRGVSIVDADGLHNLLARSLVNKPGRLTGKEFRFIRTLLAMSQAGMAKAQGVAEQSVSLWERHGKVPKANDMLARLLYLGASSNTAPIASFVDRINAVERIVHQRIVAKADGESWSSEVQDSDELSPA